MGELDPTVVREAIREAGGCGAISGDRKRVCVLDPGHGGAHGWETADHSPLVAVRDAFACAWDEHPDSTVVDAGIALRALATDPEVREWAKTVRCRWPAKRGGSCGPGLWTYVHPECLLAALAGEEAG